MRSGPRHATTTGNQPRDLVVERLCADAELSSQRLLEHAIIDEPSRRER